MENQVTYNKKRRRRKKGNKTRAVVR